VEDRRDPSGPEVPVIGPATGGVPHRPLVGRDTELARLVAALEETRLGHGRTLLLAAEAGGGKSRLMAEFRSRAEASGRLCLLGRCTPQAARNFQPFVEALEEFARRTAGSRHRSQELTASHPELATVLPTLELLLDPGHDPALEPRSKEQLWHLVDTLLKRMARKEPMVLFLDDLHWADEGTLSLLHHVTLHHGDAHLLVIGAYRPEELVRGGEADPPLVDLVRILSASDRFATMPLAPLGEADTERLVRSLPGAAAPSGRWLEVIHRRSMGNPFFALEMARLEPGEEAGLPGTIADVLNRRLARLSGEEREILEMAAVEGEVFHTDVLEAGTGVARVTLLKRLRGLGQRHQLIAAVEEGHRFSHGLIREVLLDGIPAELKREYHAVVAGTLLNGYADRDDWAGRIGHHLFEGGRFAEAVAYLTRAGLEARRLFLAERALGFLDQALGALDRAGLDGAERQRIARARCETLLDSGRPEAARAAALAERERAMADGDDGARALATTWLGEAALSQGDHGAADAWLAEALELATARQDWALAARAERKLGELLVRRGDYEAAFERLESARQACQRLGDASGVAHVRLDAGEVLVRQGRYDRAREFFDEAGEQLTAAGERPGQVRALNWLGSVDFQRGDTAAALDTFMKARALAREIGHLQESARLEANIANVHLVRGELDTADRSYREALLRFREIGDQRGAAQVVMALGNVATLRGRYVEAAAHYRTALEARESAGDRWGVANVLDNLGVVEYYLGHWDEALDHARRSHEERIRLGDRPGQAESSLNVGHLHGILGDIDTAVARYAEAEELARELGDDRRLARAWLARVAEALWRGAHEEAQRLMADVASLSLDDPTLVATFHLYQGLAAGPQARDEPEALFRQAEREAEAAGAIPELATARIGLAQAYLFAGRRDDAARELAAVLPLVAEGRLPLLELRALSLRAAAGVTDPEDRARRAGLVAALEARLPAGFPTRPDFKRSPFPVP
jgi:tetratricopeptide (TPR) repeat protein